MSETKIERTPEDQARFHEDMRRIAKSKAAHTPGPWFWGYTTVNTGTGTMTGDLILQTGMVDPPWNDRVIFAVREDWKRSLADSPNARLIAQAPELRQLVAEALEHFSDVDSVVDIKDWVKAATIVLAKIEGAK